MANPIVGRCPVCSEGMNVTRLECPYCQTAVEGKFEICRFCRLGKDQLRFVEVFIKSRGNIKEVERELGISYPTVRSKLDNVIKAMGYDVHTIPEDETGVKRREVLDMLNKGDITSKEAVKMLKDL